MLNRTKRKRDRGPQLIPKKCIFLSLLAGEGLGNTLFIYAAGLTVNKKTKLPLCILGAANPHSKSDYKTFMEGTIVDKNDIKGRFDAVEPLFNATLNKHNSVHKFTKKLSTANIPNKNHIRKNIKMKSTFYQNYSFIHAVIPKVKRSLEKHEFNKENYTAVKPRIASPAHSAFMHVRRGDYSKYGWYLPIEYYFNALKELEKEPNIKKIYIVSDDLAWCKEHDSKWKEHVTDPAKIEYLDGLNELETLYAMMLCEAGAIIANSTFSAWGAMIGADIASPHTSIIVYPSPWLNYFGKDPNPLAFPERWKQVENTSIK